MIGTGVNGSLIVIWASPATSRLPSTVTTAAKGTIAEVEHLVDVGELDPDTVLTSSVFVNRIFQGAKYEKRIERRTVRTRA